MTAPPKSAPLHPTLDQATLTPLVRQILGSTTAEVVDWTLTRVHASAGARPRRSVYRVTGTARDGDTRHNWALAVKVLRGPRPGAPDHDRADWAYWQREA